MPDELVSPCPQLARQAKGLSLRNEVFSFRVEPEVSILFPVSGVLAMRILPFWARIPCFLKLSSDWSAKHLAQEGICGHDALKALTGPSCRSLRYHKVWAALPIQGLNNYQCFGESLTTLIVIVQFTPHKPILFIKSPILTGNSWPS